MDTAKELSRMDRFYWSRGDNMDRLNATERLFVSTAEKRIRNESHPILLGVSCFWITKRHHILIYDKVVVEDMIEEAIFSSWTH